MKNNERIRKAYEKAKEYGMTYQKLAVLTGVKINTLTCWLTGKRNPPDHVVNLIEEKVSVFLHGGGEYINKANCKDDFTETVYDIFSKHSPENQPKEIVKAFDKLPTVSFNEKGNSKK